MSLKAEWDEPERRAIAKCEVIARWKGFRLVNRGRKWSVYAAGVASRTAEVSGLTLEELVTWLEGPRPRGAGA
jgi:hypothetical protein